MSIEDLKVLNNLAILHTDYEDKKSKFEYAEDEYNTASALLRTHTDYARESSVIERTRVTNYDTRVGRLGSR